MNSVQYKLKLSGHLNVGKASEPSEEVEVGNPDEVMLDHLLNFTENEVNEWVRSSGANTSSS